MIREPFADWVAPETVVLAAEQEPGSLLTAQLLQDADGWMLVLAPGKIATQNTRGDTVLRARIVDAAIWCQRASWQVRALLSRGRNANIRLPAADVLRVPITDLSTMPTLGSLIGPLFSQFRARPELRPFQRDGVTWLLAHPRGILADDMGLGKTLQALEAIRTRIYLADIRTSVVVCPRTLVATWLGEASRWAPELVTVSSTSWQGGTSSFWSLVRDCRVHLLVLHYEQLKGLPKKELEGTKLDLLLLDEAHRVRRNEASVTASVRTLTSSSIWAMSGTPIERSTEDLATLLSIIAPAKFSTSTAELGPDTIRSLARPFLLRRTKADVLEELPAVDEIGHVVELLPEQRSSYSNALSAAGRQRGSAGVLLRTIGELLTICDADPATERSSKLDDISDKLSSVALLDEKAVVFSYRLRPLSLLEKRLRLAEVGFARIDGKMSIDQRNGALDQFRQGSSTTALLASSRVASEGLTLTEANHAFFVNRWWNPSNTDQARDRLVRIGQRRPVTIHTYICADTVEQRLEEILLSKRDLVDRVVETLATGRWTALSESDLRELLETKSR